MANTQVDVAPLRRLPLGGARIWLSGAVPSEASPAEADSILAFVAGFCDRVFRQGGSIVHGSHPSLRDLILARARAYQAGGGLRERFTLVYSQWFVEHPEGDDLPAPREWGAHALVHAIPVGAEDGTESRAASLSRMREWIAARCDAVVAVGGRWWATAPKHAGVPEEFELTRARELPCFLLAGLGGAAQQFFTANPGLLDRLKNGLDAEQNRGIAQERDPARLVDLVADQLGRLPLVRGEPLGGASFRILALDGGGIKGAFTAAVLAKLQQLTGKDIARHFDLIAGTSTGGILAIGLGLGMKPDEILDFYKRRGLVIFPLTSVARRSWYSAIQFWKPKFDQATLIEELRRAYAPYGRTLGESRTRLVIPTGNRGFPRRRRAFSQPLSGPGLAEPGTPRFTPRPLKVRTADPTDWLRRNVPDWANARSGVGGFARGECPVRRVLPALTMP